MANLSALSDSGSLSVQRVLEQQTEVAAENSRLAQLAG